MSSQENNNVDCASDDEFDDNIDDWDEMESEEEPTQCLFCDDVSESIDNAVAHLHTKHHIDFSNLKGKFNMDQYSYIKMINYIRTQKLTPDQLLSAQETAWQDDAYLKPVVVDSWLMFDFEDLKIDNSQIPSSEVIKCQQLKEQLQEKDATIEQLLFQISQMQTTFHQWMDRISNGTDENDHSDYKEQTTVAEIPIKDDESYFTTYAHFSIHHEMLSDTVRTSSYRDAIILNKDSFAGKTVMDVGCGTSILSMFSSQAGAKKVIAIDQSDIIYHAMDIAQRNKISNIEFVKGRLENSVLPLIEDEKVDIIISEWMGYFLLFEGMLDSVIYARDKYLKPGGLLLPNRCTISLVGLGDEQRHNEYITFWNNVYGFDMNIMQADVLKEAIVEICPSECVISEPVVIADINIETIDYNYAKFTYNFELNIKKNGKFTAFVGYFDTFFDLVKSVEFSTGPHSEPTHWKQVVFYVKNPVDVKAGDIVKGEFHCRRATNDARSLRIKIVAFNQEFYYNIN